MKIQRLLEKKDLNLYKRLLQLLSDYDTNMPCTGVNRLFTGAIENGMNAMPKDEFALDIIKCVLSKDTTPAAVHALQNTRFADLPAEYKPIIKVGRRHEVAFWTRNGVISDRVLDLIDFAGTGKQGMWTDVNGVKQEIIKLNPGVEESKNNQEK